MAGRIFIVRISESPRRVIIEDVRTQRLVVTPDLDAVGPYIAVLLSELRHGATAAPGDSGAPARPPHRQPP